MSQYNTAEITAIQNSQVFYSTDSIMLPQEGTVSDALTSHFWFPLHTFVHKTRKINFSDILRNNSLLRLKVRFI